ncbi:hypothetical protein [Polymorphospora rubra]|uniref:hypothetical protein n=1 Tax=Polymorphospora rubra TaxID=338584 RepID=UPI0033F72F12
MVLEVEVIDDLAHPPRRPEWTCDADGAPWPCDPARVDLADRYAGRPHTLGKILCAALHLAARDLEGSTDAAELHERFVGWPAALT